MRLLITEQEASAQEKWLEVVQPHWVGKIEFVADNAEALSRLRSPYFFPLMFCRADRETILKARERGVQRVLILPCTPAQMIEEINTSLGLSAAQNRDAQVQLQVMHHTLNSLCHGPVTHRQLQWLKQRCTGEHLQLARAAIDQVLRYMDRPSHKTAEIKSALLELSQQIQFRVDRVMAMQYA